MNEYELDLVFDHALKLKLSSDSKDAAVGEVLEKLIRPYYRALPIRAGQKTGTDDSACTPVCMAV
jgi:hypothetical protein